MKLCSTWDKENYKVVLEYFNEKKDLKYLNFNKKIVNSNYPMLGVRTPDIKALVKDIKKTDIISFLECKTNNYYEEVLLEAYVIGEIQDLKTAYYYFSKYLDKIDSWSLCDMAASSMKIVAKNKDFFLERIKEYLVSDKEFVVRMGIVLLLNYYIDEDYLDEIFDLIDNLEREEYYIKMAISWLLSICYIKYREKTEEYLKVTKIDNFTYNKTISKICDSYRVDNTIKERLRGMRR